MSLWPQALREVEEGLAIEVMLLSGLQLYVWIQVCQTVTRMVTGTVNQDEAENWRPKPMSQDGEFVEVISSSKNDVLKRLYALLAEGHLTVDTRVYSQTRFALKHANTKPFVGSFLRFDDQGQLSYISLNETTRPPSLQLCSQLSWT